MRAKLTFLRVLLAMAWVLAGLLLPTAASAEPSEHPFELVPGSFHFTPSSYQAGAHADWTTAFAFEPEAEVPPTYGDARDITVEVPTGFDASNTAAPTCTFSQLAANGPDDSMCPIASQVGTITVEITIDGKRPLVYTSPLFNMEVASFGIAAELGYKTIEFTGTLQIGVRPGDLGLTSMTTDIPKIGEIHRVSVTVWGVPAAPEHDFMRGAICGAYGEIPPVCRNGFGSPQPANIPARPFLANPTKCGTVEARMQADSWEEPLSPTSASDPVGPIVECERVPFEPSIEAQPSTRAAESPTGLEVSLVVPQTWENPYAVATSYLKDTKVTLPEGMTANPGLAEGLAACTPEQYASETSRSLPGAGCPPESRIGSITIETPLLAEAVPGAIYMSKPYDNPFHSLLALYVVAKDPQRGILVKVAGKITPCESVGEVIDGLTCRSPGQLITTFDDNPQQPFSRFTLKFRPGASAPLISPPACGNYALNAVLDPWSSVEMPGEAAVEPVDTNSQPFQISEGVGGTPCPSGGIPPFKPDVISGTQNNAGGSYSDFYLRLLRHDGEQELIKFSTIFPPGLTGNLTGVAKCTDSSIEEARRKTGEEEIEHPSCPGNSEIGHTLVGAGVGTVLAQNPGKLYLAGPYHGAPLSIVSITSAKVGPFDLGTVVIRFALAINPITAQVEVSGAQSDPIPHIIKGIVVHVRDIRVYIDRPNFIINPTDCQKLGITDLVTGAGANYAQPTDEQTVSVSTPFEAADCSSLTFKPAFEVSTSGHTSRTGGASLDTKVIYPTSSNGAVQAFGQTNIKSVKVELPRQLPSRLTTLQKACTDKQFESNPAGCPAASRIGSAVVHTPILPEPLAGPAYFVSHGIAKFPELIVVLQGYGITIELHGETFISKAGITSTTFSAVPDQPFESFELDLPQGPYSALTNNGSLCDVTKIVTVRKKVRVSVKGHMRTVTRRLKRRVRGALTMPTELVAQNGASIREQTPISVSGCAKRRGATQRRHRARKGRRK